MLRASAMEIELKLALDPAAVRAVGEHPLVRHYRERAPRSREVENWYVDTPALLLWRQQVELRLRRIGGSHWQTLKRLPGAGRGARSAGGLHRLQECELPLRDRELDIAAMASALPAAAADLADLLRRAAATGELSQRVHTRYRRTTWLLRSAKGDLVELALDVGQVQACAKALPLCELELELKAGTEQALFELAAGLQRDLPLRPEPRGKAERGFALLAPVAAAPRQAEAVPLSRSADRAAAMRLVVAECLAHVQANETGVIETTDAEYVHQMRVGLRRLRSALGLFKDFASPPPALLNEVKWAATTLGRVRDAEVLAHESLVRVPAPPAATGIAGDTLRAAAVAAAVRARHEAVRLVRSPRHVAWQLALMAWACGVAEPGDAAADELQAYAAAKLRRLRRKLLRCGGKLPGASPEVRHEVRIAAKKLRHAASLLGALDPGGAGRRRLRALGALQEQLGLLNDAQVAVRGLARLAQADASLASAAAYAEGWLLADTDRRVRGLGRLWHRVQRDL
ncbi:MAG: CHAD domain-containing protein [Rubrivivax sp.]|nr:CHAD domain-containing protein [Rubrivivax sp.]